MHLGAIPITSLIGAIPIASLMGAIPIASLRVLGTSPLRLTGVFRYDLFMYELFLPLLWL